MSKRNPEIRYDDLESEFDYASETEKKKKRYADELYRKEYPGAVPLPDRSQAKNSFNEEHKRFERQKTRLLTLDVYSRHKELINQYFLYYPGATKRLQRDTSRDRNDYDVLRETHRFLWDDNELSEAAEKSWEARLAKKYYDKLFKEYCIADLTYYKKNRIALRWRIENEVRSGKGQFECGNKRCSSRTDLTSWEVNFGYVENGEKRNALVKLRLCPDCSMKLNFHTKKRKAHSFRGGKKFSNSTKRSPDDCLDEPKKKTDQKPSTSVQDPVIKSEVNEIQEPEAEDKNSKLRMEVEKMAQIWKKSHEPLDPERVAEAELDTFLEDMFM